MSDEEQLETVSVIIPTYRLLPVLSEAIEAVRANSTQKIELIVVDNSPEYDDGTRAYCENFDDITYLQSPHNSFAHAINIGLKASVGDYLVWLNNDTIVPPDWDGRLIRGMAAAGGILGIENVHLIGPISNEAGGPQRVNERLTYTTANLFEFCQKAYETHGSNFQMTGFLSGFCLMHTREVMEDIGFLDERFGEKCHGGFEDNDFVSRAILAGYRAVVYPGVFVHHQGSRTFQRYFMDDRNGLKNRLVYHQKWKEEFQDKTKLGVIYRVRILNERHMGYFLRSVRKSASVADCIAVFNDKSKVKQFKKRVEEAVVEGQAQRDKYDLGREDVELKIENKKGDVFNERDDRNRLIDICRTMDPDWLFSLDHDECMEDGLTRKALERLMRGPDPLTKAFAFHFCTFHDGEEKFRKDGIMGAMFGHRMFRNVPGFKIIAGNNIGFHCGNGPQFASNEKAGTSYRIMHFGYVHADEDRERKRDYYNEMDKDLDPSMVGGKDYNHVASLDGLRLVDYVPDNSGSLCMIVLNEEKFIGQCLARQWSWYDEIVIVDTGSTDDTIELCKCFTDNVYDFTKRERFFDKEGRLVNFSAARNFSIEQANNIWMWVLDADEYIANSELIRHMMDEDLAGYVHMIKNLQPDGTYTFSESVRSFKKDTPGFRFTSRIHETIHAEALANQKIQRVDILNHINEGFLKGDVVVQGKLENYINLLLTQIRENPDDGKAFYAIGSHFINREKLGDAEWALARSIELLPKFYPAQRDLALMYLRKAMKLFVSARNCIPNDHPSKNSANHIINFIRQNSGQIKVGLPGEMGDWDVLGFRQITGILDKLSTPTLQSDRLSDDEMSEPLPV